MKVFNIVFGILSIVVAVICFAHPFASQIMYSYIVSIFIGAMGVMSIIAWYQTRKQLKSSGIAMVSGGMGLAIGIFGVVFMLLNMTVPFFTYAVQEFGAIVVGLFMLTEGITMVYTAITNKTRTTTGMRFLTGAFGVLMIIAFTQALMFPAGIIAMFGIFLGVAFLIHGISRISLALSL